MEYLEDNVIYCGEKALDYQGVQNLERLRQYKGVLERLGEKFKIVNLDNDSEVVPSSSRVQSSWKEDIKL